jgi:hypothetical protein
MFTAYTPAINAGRFDPASVYTLPHLLKVRASLASGIVEGFRILTVPDTYVLLDDGIDFLVSLIRANATEQGAAKSVEKVTADTIINRLEGLRGQEGKAVADGNTRSLAILLHYGMTGETIDYPTEDTKGDPRNASFAGNVASSLAFRMEWKARTAYVMDLISRKPNISESEIMRETKLGRGVAQHATASAVAVAKHKLDLGKCVSLTASEWRTVRDAETQADAEAIAYGQGARKKAFSPKQEAEKFISRNGLVGPYVKLLQAIVNDDAEAFVAELHNTK